MARGIAFVLLLLALPALAQPGEADGPALVLLLHHPYPDAADPLGFEYPPGSGTGYYHQRYAHLDAERDGFDFPHMVMDGVLPVEGIPDGPGPMVATQAAYDAAFEARRDIEAPVAMVVDAAIVGDAVSVAITTLPRADLSGEPLHLWVALVEDHVQYAPPPRLSNGVTDHRFTVRAIQELGALNGTARADATATFPGAWPPANMFVAAWVQADAQGGRFEPHEVVQATIDAVGGGATRQDGKGVLMQLYSATWCDPCLFGDRAAEALAAEHGPATGAPPAPDRIELAPPAWVLAAAVFAGIGVATARIRRPQ